MGALRPTHWVVLIIIVILIFGANRLPDIARSVGQSMKVFRKEVKDLREDEDKDSEPAAQIEQPQQGTYFTQPTQPGQSAGHQGQQTGSRQ
ncbi:twin-arginine translocase TatA/TatE family subunit [Actinomyces sp. 2119]|uniref:Sec-independent protein translocase protein TatA n=1 Tax=Actinomyces lilanjuaniae TaxID=2321394 RepID=A0ABM6Z382_9ACTO|nr:MULTISPECIES: Sec-independent protein translocase subunit TatA [Actinomyces]AYD89789.1 twin-arginine translocase TatA/TatE family subunit [Actinomyces lilanjuaniae]RJF44764.1 twin-arginine translocase TatA/TatE family subunit [Actinomyces sp. 2119]